MLANYNKRKIMHANNRGELMTFSFSFLTVFFIAVLGNKFIKKYAVGFYIFSAIISTVLVIGTKFNLVDKIPDWISRLIWYPFFKGSVAGAIFILVMIVSILDNRSIIKKNLMSIRAELSIIASIFTLGHNFSMSQSYFDMLSNGYKNMPLNYFAASICSLIMFIIMIPLFITSFKFVQSKINSKRWKKLHKSAYIFYVLMYVHVVLLIFPKALSGNKIAIFNIIIYSTIFLIYGVLRIRKALRNKLQLFQLIPIAGIIVLLIFVSTIVMPTDTDVKEQPVSGATTNVK